MNKSRNCRIVVASVVLACSISSSASASLVLFDHFDDNAIDSAWSISTVNAAGWTGGESGTELTVTDLARPSASFEGWISVSFTQVFTPVDDFHVDFDFSWSQTNTGFPWHYQTITIGLFDENGVSIAGGGHSDPWSGTGQRVASAGGNSFGSGAFSQPPTGSAEIDIDRINDEVEVLWNGDSLVNGTSTLPLASLTINFSYWSNFNGASAFGSESVDRVEVNGVIPEPSSLAFLVISGICITCRCRRSAGRV